MTALTTWACLALLLIGTLRLLPFLDAELSLRLQWWLRDCIRRLEEKIAVLEREREE